MANYMDMEDLQQRTRALGFDFDRVAAAMSTPQRTFTAAECRLAYASSFLPVTAVATTAAATTTSTSAATPANTVPSDVTDGMSFREMMDVIAARQERNDRRKEKIFSRVLAALGPGAGVPSVEGAEDSSELQLIKAQMAERKQRRELEAARRDKENKDLEEARWLQVRPPPPSSLLVAHRRPIYSSYPLQLSSSVGRVSGNGCGNATCPAASTPRGTTRSPTAPNGNVPRAPATTATARATWTARVCRWGMTSTRTR